MSPLTQHMFPDLDSKINGMLLEMDNAKLVYMLDNQKPRAS